jgi:hypothetical protein
VSGYYRRVHANMIFPATPVLVSRVQCAYGDFLKGGKAIQPVTDFRGLLVTTWPRSARLKLSTLWAELI